MEQACRHQLKSFHGRLAKDDGVSYVRSGDLGFFHEGELFVTGRLKDMIIVRGVNRYPQDIEATVETCDERLRSGGAAAFAVDHWDREHLVVVCEVERRLPGFHWDELLNKIRTSVTSEHDLPPDAIVLVRHNSVPKTSSGKVQRHACRKEFLDGTLKAVAQWSAWEDTEKQASLLSNGESLTQTAPSLDSSVLETVKDRIKLVAKERAGDLTPETNIVTDLGLDSLERMEIARELELAFDGRFPDEVLQELKRLPK